MCLIIQRPANIKLDFENFKVAVENNPDGYGLAVPDNSGKLLVIRNHNKPDIDNLYKLIHEEFKDQRLMLHLRYTTAGETSLRNAHPFPILERSTDGIDLRMAHNGTLHAYKGNTGESDTRRFVKQFVRPLFKRLCKGMDVEDILTDPFVYDLLKDKLTTQSVITFIDGNGNTLEVNATGNGGFYSENGVFYSNKYSFNKNHRKPATSNYHMGGASYRGSRFWEDDDDWSDWVANQNKDKDNEPPPAPQTTSKKDTHALDTQVKRFSEEYGIDLEFFPEMDDKFIDDLVYNDPEGAKSLIMELLFELELGSEEVQ